MDVADLHCDLLCYLSFQEGRSAENEESRCAISQLKKGKVFFQVLAIYTETGKKSEIRGQKQFEIFQTLPKKYDSFVHLKELKLPERQSEKITIAVAFENASGLVSEEEDLSNCFQRIDAYQKKAPILYISLTWNHENRFGGGNLTKVGLKKDGERLLDFLSGKKIAIDLSHASDFLGHDILNTIDKKGLDLIPIASHSNYRGVTDQPRNLPDFLALEIKKRGGIIGLNFVRSFIGSDSLDNLPKQMAYARLLVGLETICLGADFFCEIDFPYSLSSIKPYFFERFGNSSCYPDFFDFVKGSFKKEELEKIAHQNLERFLTRLGS